MPVTMIPSWRRGLDQTLVEAPDVLEARKKKLDHRGVGLCSLCVWLTSIHKKPGALEKQVLFRAWDDENQIRCE